MLLVPVHLGVQFFSLCPALTFRIIIVSFSVATLFRFNTCYKSIFNGQDLNQKLVILNIIMQ